MGKKYTGSFPGLNLHNGNKTKQKKKNLLACPFTLGTFAGVRGVCVGGGDDVDNERKNFIQCVDYTGFLCAYETVRRGGERE